MHRTEIIIPLEYDIEKWWHNALIEESKISLIDDSVKTIGKPIKIVDTISLNQ